MTWPGRVARAAVVGLLVYWFVYCVVAFANVIDAQSYNQARLYVIKQGGLFHNDIFRTPVQISFPWTFDAVHWPFLQLSFGHPLPGWLCLIGTMVIVYQVAREEVDAECAWLCCLALLAMPSIAYQATSTKNDFPMIFGVFCWYWAMRRFRQHGRRVDLVASAVAAAFAGGVKVTGLLFVPLLVAASVWMLRAERRALLVWMASMTLAGLLLLSVETYVAAWVTFGDWRGPGDGYALFRNQDGVPGTVANVIRFAFLNIDTGADALLKHKSALTVLTERWCLSVLAALGIADRGWMGFTDPVLDLTKTGHEATAGYGPIGTLGMLVIPVALILRRPREWTWRLAAGALFTFALLSASIGWEVYNDRRLVLPFALAGLCVTLLAYRFWRTSAAIRVAFLGVLLYGAVALPLTTSFNRKPRDLWLWVTDRDRITTREQPSMLQPVRKVRQLVAACPASVWVIAAPPFSWELSFYQMLGDRALIRPLERVNAASLEEIRRRVPDRTVFVLTILQRLRMFPRLDELYAFVSPRRSWSWTRIYRYGPRRCG